MARPVKVRFFGGEVQFHRVPKDKQELARAVLVKLDPNNDYTEVKVEIPPPASTLTEVTIGLSKERNKNGQYEISVIKYNPTTGESQVAEVEEVGDHKSVALSKYKFKLYTMGIV